MKALAPSERALAVMLAALAGYVDSLGFLHLGGLFVSFMSGNSTRLAVSLSHGDWLPALTAAGLLILFVVGAMLGALAAGPGGAASRSRVLTLEAGLLAGAAAAAALRWPHLAVALMVLAMAVENSVFLRKGEVAVSLTYMTGTLFRIGHALAASLRGGDPWAFRPYLILWLGLAAGAVAGALAYGGLELMALWPGAAVAAVLAMATRLRREA